MEDAQTDKCQNDVLVVLIVFLITEAPRIVMPCLVFSYLSAIERMTNLKVTSILFQGFHVRGYGGHF